MYPKRITMFFVSIVLLTSLFTTNDTARGRALAQNGAPQVVSYQGQVKVDGTAYTGSGYFKFAVVNPAGSLSYWSNDGTSTAGSAPTDAVALTVSSGLFNVLLGDTTLAHMTALPASAFSDTERYLRVWFSSDNATFTLLNPDRRIAAVPYALQAEEAKTAVEADTLDGQHAAAFQNRISGACTVGSTIRAINADGSVVCQLDAPLNRPLPPGVNTITTMNATNTGMFIALALGADGLGLISYFDGNGSDLKAAHCSDIACSTMTFSTLDSPGNVGQHIAMTIGADGLGLIGYHDATSTNNNLKVAHCSDTACSAAALTTLDSAASVGFYTSVTIGGDGLGLISYHDSLNYDLKVAHCSNAACSAATITALDTTGVVGFNTSITTGTDGLGLISYYDFTNTNLKVAHCSNAVCSAATFTTLDSTGDDGRESSVTIGTDGLGLISYYDATNTDLKVAHCSNVTCSAATLATLDSTGDVGRYTSLTIGADGLGLIGYYDVTNQDLKMAHCSNVTCSAATLTTLDSTGNVGQNTSLAIGADGLGLISYFDNTNYRIKVAHCASTFCTPYFRRR